MLKRQAVKESSTYTAVQSSMLSMNDWIKMATTAVKSAINVMHYVYSCDVTLSPQMSISYNL